MLKKALSTAALIAGLGFSTSAFAQDTNYDNSVLEAYVTAALAIAPVEQQYVADMSEATTEAEQQELTTDANEQIVETIESTPGVDVDTYVEISQAAQADPELNQRLMTLAQQRQAN